MSTFWNKWNSIRLHPIRNVITKLCTDTVREDGTGCGRNINGEQQGEG